MVFLIADLESTSKVTSIDILFIIIIDFYGNLVFGRNLAFAVREQHATVRKKLNPQSGWKCSKYPALLGILLFFFEI